MQQDILTIADIKLLVDGFYDKVKVDELMANSFIG